MVSKIEILIYNLSKEKVPSKKFFEDLVSKTLKILKEKDKVSLSLVFIEAITSQQLNNYWRYKNSVASVLTFPLQDNLSKQLFNKEKILGDIFLCPEKIKEQAKEFKISLTSFYKKITIHSLLHLYGYSHSQEKEAQKMEKLENKILTLLNIN